MKTNFQASIANIDDAFEGKNHVEIHAIQVIEQAEAHEFEQLKEELSSIPNSKDTPEKKKLKRELKAEALARLEQSARSASDFNNVVDWWDKLDENRERRERYHEISRSGDDIPLDYGAKKDGTFFPNFLSNVFEKQVRNGDFIDVIFNCPYEIHELITAEYLSKILKNLNENHRELLYLHAIMLLSSKKIDEIRGQSDRNIRKIRVTMFNRIHEAILLEIQNTNNPLTIEEKRLIAGKIKTSLDESKEG